MTQVNARATNISAGSQFWKNHSNTHHHKQDFLSICKSCYSYNKLILSQEGDSLSLPCSFTFAIAAILQPNSNQTRCTLKLITSDELLISDLNTSTFLLGGLD